MKQPRKRKVAPIKNLPAVIPAKPDPRHQARLLHYAYHRSVVGEALLRAALRALASTDAVTTVNVILENKFGLTDVQLDSKEASQNIMTVLRAEVAQILARSSVLTAAQKRRLVTRIVARMLPRRDNIPGPGPRSAPDPLRHDDLERLIQRELNRETRK